MIDEYVEPVSLLYWQAPAMLLSVKAYHINIQICGDISAVRNCDGRIWRITGNQIMEQIISKAETNIVRDFVGACGKIRIVGCNRERELILLSGDCMVEITTESPVFLVGRHSFHYAFVMNIFVVLVNELLSGMALEAS